MREKTLCGKASVKLPVMMEQASQATSPWWKKMGWLIVIWCGSVLALLAVSMLFRMMMTAAGMKPISANTSALKR